MTVGVILFLLGAICIGFGVWWSRLIGWGRGVSAAVCRFLWVCPLVLSMTPETITETLPNILVQQPIHILLDDSASMRGGRFNAALSAEVQATLKDIEDTCKRFGCLPKLERLSEMRPETSKGFTPLSAALEPWLFKIGSEPWIVLSDGADWRPSRLWDERLQGRGAKVLGKQQGLIVGFGKPAVPGFWLEDIRVPSFAFEGRSTKVDVGVARAATQGIETVQVQVAVDGKAVASANAVFADGSTEGRAELTFASPARGPHLITVKSLPVSDEKDIWDNETNVPLEVLPNTIGVLHLLGAPSWDGRFLRRYLKAEPKFDLISFFILRDPWDSQQVSERELSLIPFPSERLFNEELSSFRVLVIQNFTMQRFLQPEYQRNLVKFVLDGGGLLFIGGPRALTEGDIRNSPMADLLPFTVGSGGLSNRRDTFGISTGDDALVGSTYDSQVKYSVSLAEPDAQKRSLANVYDDWEKLSTRLSNLKSLQGLHKMSSFTFRSEDVTPLLNAKMDRGPTVPLAVASYPGKGRAIWLFSDSLWRLGMDEEAERSRFDYNEFLDGAMTWLMRNDRRPSLIARDFKIERSDDEQSVIWQARISGPAARYVGAKGGEWSISVCGHNVPSDRAGSEQQSTDEWRLSGVVPGAGNVGTMCSLTIAGQHPAFGSVKASALAVFSDTLKDIEMSPSPRKLRQLSEVSGATYVSADADRSRLVTEWIRSWTGDENQAIPNRFKTIRDFYWAQRRPWIWLVLFLLPVEVLIRRWHLLVGRKANSAAEGEADT